MPLECSTSLSFLPHSISAPLNSFPLTRYLRFVKPSFDDHIQPTSRYADILVPGQRNEKSIDLITGHIRRQLDERKMELRGELFSDTQGGGAEGDGGAEEGVRLPETVTLLKQGSQLRVSAEWSCHLCCSC